MMIGEWRSHQSNPAVELPLWTDDDDPTARITAIPGNAEDYPPLDVLMALHRYLPSNDADSESDLPSDAYYSSDHFRMFDFKVRKCTRGRSHDWTDCPYAHPGEKARRRDPRKYHYSGTACPEFRKGNCKKGDNCEYAHGVFECWLHPARYRTQPCKDGVSCSRRVCFFAHTPEQLRVLSPRTPPCSVAESYDGSPLRLALEGSCARALAFMSSPESVSPPSESPPMSPMTNSLSRSLGSSSVNELVASLRQLQLNKVKSMPASWAGVQVASSGFGSPRPPISRPSFCSLPSTPTRAPARRGMAPFDLFCDNSGCEEEEPVMERVESGRELRAKMFEKLSRENPLDRAEAPPGPAYPDVGWVSELLK
ncbi:zinc finger CCCH domain-containing protein 49-like [Diospyros lotus]|uniref:zinc finger CCCH domain-containing protein 49-like n=1 Tax=Diospyros lotus TaxID=55363 RepID=UPI00225458CB|nr:zinc finger CCCH domain-containing protein 49-like [Diospyros lotus]